MNIVAIFFTQQNDWRDSMDEKLYNELCYYKSISIAKNLVKKNILTEQESQQILEKLKQYYKIK